MKIFIIFLIICVVITTSSTAKSKSSKIRKNSKFLRSPVETHLTIDAAYTCEPGSYFDTISRHIELNAGEWDCFQMVEGKQQLSINVTRNENKFELGPILGRYLSLVNKGDQTFVFYGTMNYSECLGDLVVIKQFSPANDGDCRSGIKHSQSKSADFLISGKCDSYCSGDVSIIHQTIFKKHIKS